MVPHPSLTTSLPYPKLFKLHSYSQYLKSTPSTEFPPNPKVKEKPFFLVGRERNEKCARRVLPHRSLEGGLLSFKEEIVQQKRRVDMCDTRLLIQPGICESSWNKECLERYRVLIPLYEDLQCLSFDPTRATSLVDLVKGEYPSLPETASEFAQKVMEFFLDKKREGVVYFTSFISPTFRRRRSSEEEINRIYLKKLSGEELSLDEQNALVTWLLYCYLNSLQELGSPAQFYVGAYWARPGMRYGESYVWTDHQYILDLVSVFKDFPRVRFNLMYASLSISQELIIVSRMLPNVSLLGFWWHTFLPATVEMIISQRLESLPVNKWIAIATDAYSVEWAYGKTSLVLNALAKVLSQKIEEGYLSEKKALWIARQLLYENPKEIYEL